LANKIKIAIYGGSFDPFHNGHKNVLEGLLKLNKFDQIIVMPLGLAPHKDKYMTPSGYRYEMTRLGIKDLPGLTLSDYEINRPGQYSYTVDTIDYYKQKIYNEYINEELKKLSKLRVPRGKKTKYKTDAVSLKNLHNVKVKITLVYGSDALDTIENWYEPERIMKKADLLICRRGSEDSKHMNERADYLRTKYQADIDFFDIEETDISSTELREKLKQDKKQKNKIPPAVCQFIKNNKIYVFNDEMAQLSREQLIQLAVYEKEVRKNVSRSRLNHSLNVMQYAVHLATKHDYDLMKAAVTGILHDIAKSMNIEKQYRFAKKTGKLKPLNKNIAHGPAGAWYIHRYLGITDREILDALIFHTTSRKKMTKLDQIIYLADKIEYGRPFPNLDLIREAAETDLNFAMRLCLTEVRLALRRRSKKGHPITLAATKYIESH
jgi:nicotinate-nucleotide adenylyltransferase